MGERVSRFASITGWGSVSSVYLLREGRKPGAFMNPRVIPTCIAFWPGEKELNLNIKHMFRLFSSTWDQGSAREAIEKKGYFESFEDHSVDYSKNRERSRN